MLVAAPNTYCVTENTIGGPSGVTGPRAQLAAQPCGRIDPERYGRMRLVGSVWLPVDETLFNRALGGK